jgi:glycosyltransferase involved in cell wall biosynthesis
MGMQLRLAFSLRRYDALYIRSHTLAFPIALLAHALKVPVVQECNGPYEDLFIAWPQVRPLRQLLIWAWRVQYEMAEEVITVTQQLAEWLEHEGGHERVTVIANGVNTSVFRPDAASPVETPDSYAIFFGSLAPWQGIETMLAAVTSAEWPADVSLLVVGDGALRPEIEAAKVRGEIIYLGSMPRTELPGLVAGAVASLSVQDDTERSATGLSPLKLYESMATATPLVASDLPGLADTVRECGCGIVIGPGDAQALASAVAAFAHDPGLRERMGRAGRAQAVAHHSWDAVTEKTAAVIERAIARRARRERR